MPLSRKPFRIGHMFIKIFFLRMTDNMSTQNINLSSWDTLYIYTHTHTHTHTYIHKNTCVWLKVKCTLIQALRLSTGRTAHRGSRGLALLFLDHGTIRRWVVSVTPRPLFIPGKTRYPFYRRLGGPQGRSGQVRKISLLTGIRSPDRPARSQYVFDMIRVIKGDYVTKQNYPVDMCDWNGIFLSLHRVFWNLRSSLTIKCIIY